MAVRNADVLDLVPTLDTSIYADGDVLFDTTAITNFFRSPGEGAFLQSIHVLDEDDQGVALDLVFFNALVSLGTINAAPSISDANARAIVGIVNVPAAGFVDLGGCRVTTLRGVGLQIRPPSGVQAAYVAGITRGGTPTYTANGLRFKFGLHQD